MAELLFEVAQDLSLRERVDLEMAARVEEVCRRYGMPVIETLCVFGLRDRLTLDILLEGQASPDENGRWYRDLCHACGTTLGKPSITVSGCRTHIHVSEKTRYTVLFGSAQLNCHAERLCGDAFERFYDRNGRFCVVLSDGMGTGGRAAVDGAMTAALAGRMMQAGFKSESILRVLNSALIMKSEDESLSTLDTLTIDLYTGRVENRKAGAAPSFLCSRGRVSRIQSTTLPIGILRDLDTEEYVDHVSGGDTLVMISDGVVSDDSDWLEEMIARAWKRKEDAETLAREIVSQARLRQGTEQGDDTTALVLQIV